jgi:tetratricopeptide (TPR) repeat protein
MSVPGWQNLKLGRGVLREPCPEDDRLILWIPGERQGWFQKWDRLSTVPRAPVIIEQGICAIAASSVPTRQALLGWLFPALGQLRKKTEEGVWRLPNGRLAESCGARQYDLLVVWIDDETAVLDEKGVQARWPQSQRVQGIGNNLFLVTGVAVSSLTPQAEEESKPSLDCPYRETEELLTAARARGDRPGEVTALTDLGIILIRQGDARRALGQLQEALTLARQLGDPNREGDVLSYLGLAARHAGQLQVALSYLEQALDFARQAGDRYAEKTALFHLGLTYSSMASPAQAVQFFGEALVLARAVKDRRHVIELLWYLSIHHAQLGQRDLAIDRGQEVVDLLREKGDPQAAWFDHHLQMYRSAQPATDLAEYREPALSLATGRPASLGTTSWETPLLPNSVQETKAGNPGWLLMAFTAAKAMAQFLGSAFKTVPGATHRLRLQNCGVCQHHTGMRCRACGCFTKVKAWLPHEECPLGKWPV